MSNIDYQKTQINRFINSEAYRKSCHPDSARIRKYVTDWFKEIYDASCSTKFDPAYFINHIPCGDILLVGEGNLSFAVSLAFLPYIDPTRVIASVYEKESEISEETFSNALILKKLGVRVNFNTNATKINICYPDLNFGTIIFQFPHTGSRKPIYGHNPNFMLIKSFLKSIYNNLKTEGKVLISSVDTPYYEGAFQFEKAAEASGFQITETLSFDPADFPGYHHTNTNDEDSALEYHTDFKTLVFTKQNDNSTNSH